MERKILSYQYSLIGRFDSIYNDINSFSNLFTNYPNKEIQRDIMPNGSFLNCYILKNEKNAIIVHFDRIDFVFSANDTNNLELFTEFYKKIKKQIGIIGRIAINYNCFFKDNDCTLANMLSSKLNIISDKNNISEFSMRQNRPFSEDKIVYNNIVTIQKGVLQKNDSFETFNALIILIDINSADLKDNSNNFNNDSLLNSFSSMQKKLNNQLDEVDEFFKGK